MSRGQGTSESSSPRIPRVVALLMDGMWAHDLANVIQVFGNGAPLKGQAPCELTFASTASSALLDHGLSAATTPLRACDTTPDLVCVPGFVDPCRAIQSDETDETIAWLRESARHGAEVASLGTGAFVLGAAGLLDGVRCTTHHAFSAEFRLLFPRRCWTRTPSSRTTARAAYGRPRAGPPAWTSASRSPRTSLAQWLRRR